MADPKLTREQIEEFRFAITGGGLLGGTMPTGSDVVTMCTMLLDGEADRELGAVVRLAIATHASTPESLLSTACFLDVCDKSEGDDILRAIAAQLRKEQIQ